MPIEFLAEFVCFCVPGVFHDPEENDMTYKIRHGQDFSREELNKDFAFISVSYKERKPMNQSALLVLIGTQHAM